MLSFVMSPLLMPPLFGFQSASLLPALARSWIAERLSMSRRCLAAEYLFANEASAGVPINDEKGFTNLVGVDGPFATIIFAAFNQVE